MLEWKRGGLTQEILYGCTVLSGGRDVAPRIIDVHRPGMTDTVDWYDDEWYCVLPEIKVPASPTKVVLEEYCRLGNVGATFMWQRQHCPPIMDWVKTGVTREVEVPND